MTSPLSLQEDLEPETMWRAMRELLERVYGVLDRDTALDDCLDIVVELLGADRGLVMVVDDHGATRTIYARGKGKTLGALEREEISKTIIREALESGAHVRWDASALSASSSVHSLGILAALAAPIRTPRAVLYVDVRDPRKYVERAHVEFFLAASLLVGGLLEERARASQDRARLGEALAHTTEARRTPPLEDIVAYAGLGALRSEIHSATRSDQSVLLLGESGTGKTLLAQALAESSGRRPIVRAMLGGSDDLNTLTSELFGHERGAFSGAVGKRVGLVEFADGGTLVLDELLNLPLHAQRLLLDFTQFGTYRPLGHERAEPKRARVRIIGATNGDLRQAIRDGRFREDLYHRLAGIVLDLPPLRDRREDIPSLAESLLRRGTRTPLSLSLGARRLLVSQAIGWAGNVRQLERVVMRARDRALDRDPEARELLAQHFEARDLDGVTPEDPPASGREPLPPAAEWQRLQGERARIDEAEVAVVRQALASANGVVAQAARSLGVARTTLSSRIEVLGLRGRSKGGEG